VPLLRSSSPTVTFQKKRKLWLRRLQSNHFPLLLHPPPSWLFPPLNMNITHRSLIPRAHPSPSLNWYFSWLLSRSMWDWKNLLEDHFAWTTNSLRARSLLCCVFDRPMHWVIGSPKCSAFAFIEDYSLSVSISTRSYSSIRLDFLSDFIHDMMSFGPMAFNFCIFVWDLAVPGSMQPADVRLHPHRTSSSSERQIQYLQVTSYLLTSRRRLMISSFNPYSIADTMYNPVPNLRSRFTSKIRYLALRKVLSKDFNCVGRAFIGERHEFESISYQASKVAVIVGIG